MKLRIDQHPAPNSRATVFYVYDEDAGRKTDGPFIVYSKAEEMLRKREQEHNSGFVTPTQSTGGRKIDLTTHDEKYLRQRVLDLEYVVEDLLGPVSPGKVVNPGRRMIEGWFYPWRLEAACKVLHGKRANEVYTRAKGDVDSEHADGRRRALRISD